MEHTKKDVRVGPSQHGLGVFSLRPFAPGDVIGPIQGDVISDPDYGSDYGIEFGDQTLEPAAPFRFLNHSCQPNCTLVIFEEEAEDGEQGSLSAWIEVVSDIAPGEQLTIDYAWPADAAIPCGCGAPSCRGWIVDPDRVADVAGR